jgi:CPA1 family monovalent cation:H+ antiporter
MALFESLLLLLFVSAFLLMGSRRLGVPYPTLLCLAGVGVAALPQAPAVAIEPHLVLALFIAPALLDAAYDTSPRELKRLWVVLLALAVGAVLLTAAAVALVGVTLGGLPLFAAIALGAIVAPPDAAAGTAMLRQVGVPRSTSLVLQGEGLLNDATALLLFSAATSAVSSRIGQGGPLQIAFAAPGGIAFGLAAAWGYTKIRPLFAGTLSGIVLQFTMTFAVWILADQLHLSPVLALAADAMLIAQLVPAQISARERIQSYAAWSLVVFVLNVLAFLLMGLQARAILGALHAGELRTASLFALAVLATVIVVRLVSVLGYRALAGLVWRYAGEPAWLPRPPSWRLSILVSWCGMRGLLTLATALALPAGFPGRNLIVLAAFTVVLGTLIVQGATLKPLMRVLDIREDDGFVTELSHARKRMLQAGIGAVGREDEAVAEQLGRSLHAAAQVAQDGDDPQGSTHYDRATWRTVKVQRRELHRMRGEGLVSTEVFYRLEEELDWIELAARPTHETAIGET